MSDEQGRINRDGVAVADGVDDGGGGDDGAHGGADEGGAEREGVRQVPVTEAIRYRKRAQAAEQSLEAMERKLEAMEAELDEARATASQLERRGKIDALLTESEAIDVEAARLLTEQVVAQMDEPDVEQAVSELKRSKPYLFRQRRLEGGGVMGARHELGDEHAEEAAAAAAASGDRRDLLRYLRLRRGGAGRGA